MRGAGGEEGAWLPTSRYNTYLVYLGFPEHQSVSVLKSMYLTVPH